MTENGVSATRDFILDNVFVLVGVAIVQAQEGVNAVSRFLLL